jgi:small subunit ribosomal protein S8
MPVTDPIADMLTRIRNATVAGHDEVAMPSSKAKIAIADILRREGYIREYVVVTEGKLPELKIELKWGANRRRTINGLKRISKPGLRVYARRDALPKVLGGLGIAILSTDTGLLTDRQAAKAGVGGEVLCFVW